MKVILTGDLNLMNVTDPKGPFAKVRDEFRAADLVFSNLECMLYEPTGEAYKSGTYQEGFEEGFFANPAIAGAALKDGGIKAVGIANNVNFGAAGILASVAELDKLGIPHTGGGANMKAARQPAIVEVGGKRFGFLQRSSVYWPTNHAAGAHTPGIAVIKGHTAYEVPIMHTMRPRIPAFNRPGVPPIIMTWADHEYVQWLVDDIKALKEKVDFVVVSAHWGLFKDILEYQKQIAHAALDAGADVVIGTGPHLSLPVEVYKGKPIFYGLGNFSFHTGHGGLKHGDWICMMAKLKLDGNKLVDARFQFVRHNDKNETVPCKLENEAAEFADIKQRSADLGAKIRADGDEVVIELA